MKNEYGKHGIRNSKLGTENLRTQDVKPKTENGEPETSLLIGPNFAPAKLGGICRKANLRPKSLILFPVLGFRFLEMDFLIYWNCGKVPLPKLKNAALRSLGR